MQTRPDQFVLHEADDVPRGGHSAPARHDTGPVHAPRDHGDSRTAARPVVRANLLASGMSPLDARWVMARRVAEQLEGGRAAVLAPDRRRGLVRMAERLGLRAFDANLVIAIVQDGRRTGAGALCPDVEGRLALVPAAQPPTPSRAWAVLPVAAVALGLVVCAGLVWWAGGVGGGGVPQPVP